MSSHGEVIFWLYTDNYVLYLLKPLKVYEEGISVKRIDVTRYNGALTKNCD